MMQLLVVSFVTGLALGLGVGIPLAIVIWWMNR